MDAQAKSINPNELPLIIGRRLLDAIMTNRNTQAITYRKGDKDGFLDKEFRAAHSSLEALCEEKQPSTELTTDEIHSALASGQTLDSIYFGIDAVGFCFSREQGSTEERMQSVQKYLGEQLLHFFYNKVKTVEKAASESDPATTRKVRYTIEQESPKQEYRQLLTYLAVEIQKKYRVRLMPNSR